MNTKRTVIGMLVAMAFVVGWYFLLTYVNEKYPQKKLGQDSPPTETASPTSGPTSAAGAAAAPATGRAEAPGESQGPQLSQAGLRVIDAAVNPAGATLGSEAHEHKDFALGLEVTPEGAGVAGVALNDFLASVDDPAKQPYRFQEGDPEVLELYGRPLATRSITVDGTTVDVSKVIWRLESDPQPGRVSYSITLGTPGKPVLKVVKTFRVFTRTSPEHGGSGYEVRIDHAFENHSGRPLDVSLSYNGPAVPPRELLNGPDQRVMAGYKNGPNIAVENHYVETFKDDTATIDLLLNEDKEPMWWAGTSSVYFQAILMPPLLPDGRTTSITSFKGIGLHSGDSTHHPVAITADTAVMHVAANDRLTYPVNVFFGPKWRHVLNQPFFAAPPRDYDQTLVVRTGPCSICTFDWLINVLVAMLGAFHFVARDWGLAIICLVVLVRLALHPITKRSQISMLKMGKMGPEMKRLQEKYKDNKEELQKAMWQFQKQQGITPILGCLPMFLQMPIWIALWSALNTTFELRHSSFLWGWTWINDLAKPDRLIPFPAGWGFHIPLLGTPVDAVNALPVLLAFVFFLQQKYTPKPATATKEQEQQQKIMQGMMVFLFPLFLYGQPSGLNLYILTSTAIGIWESKRIRRHIKEKEEAEKAGVVIIDAEPDEGGGSGGGGSGGGGSGGGGGGGGKKGKKDLPLLGGKGKAAKQPAPGGWLARKLAALQKKAEDAQRGSDRRRGRDRA